MASLSATYSGVNTMEGELPTPTDDDFDYYNNSHIGHFESGSIFSSKAGNGEGEHTHMKYIPPADSIGTDNDLPQLEDDIDNFSQLTLTKNILIASDIRDTVKANQDDEPKEVEQREQGQSCGNDNNDDWGDQRVNEHVVSKFDSSIAGTMSASKEKSLSNVSTQEPANNPHGSDTTPRRRGRPPGRRADKGQGKRKRDSSESGLRRSNRAAAKSAIEQMTEQSSKRSKSTLAPPTPSTPTRKKVAFAPNSGSGKRSSGRVPTKKRVTAEYEVETILKERKRSGATEYLVKWKDYQDKDNTWEPAENLTHCAQALKQFRASEVVNTRRYSQRIKQ